MINKTKKINILKKNMSNSIPLSSDDNNELNNISSDPQEDNFFVEQPSIIEPSLDEICKIILYKKLKKNI